MIKRIGSEQAGGEAKRISKRGDFVATPQGCLLLLALGITSSTISNAAPGLMALHGHVPQIVRRLEPKGALPADQSLRLAIGVPLGNEAGLSNFLEKVYNPSDALFRHYLTPGEFAEKFGPTPAQYEQVVDFARKNHLKITARHASRLLLDVNGSVEDIQRAFHVTLRKYAHPSENRDFYAPDSEPVVEDSIPIADVIGLSDYSRPRPRSIRLDKVNPSSPVTHAGSGPGGTYLGKDFRTAYVSDSTLTGAGQVLGLLQFDGFYASDIDAYEKAAGLRAVPIETVLVDGYDGIPSTGPQSGNAEVSLDIETALSMAPGLDKMIVFEAGPNGFQNDLLSSMASHTEVKQFSCSWGWNGGPNRTTDNLFKQMAAQGQSFFSASGDSDAFEPGTVDDPDQVNTPSSNPYITVVGGTRLAVGTGGAWNGESVWNRGGGVGSSGGVSSHYNLPSWQGGMDMSVAGGSAAYRNIPDVAGVAENVYVAYGNGTNGAFGGTSCAAPVWAGLAALMNQRSMGTKGVSIGFINPAVYALAKTAAYPQAFHDVTSGNNTWTSSPDLFYATTGYDLCTGLGSPGPGLIDALAGVATTLKPLAPIGFSSIVRSGGGVRLGWESSTGVQYQPQYSTDLLHGAWSNLGNPVTGTGTSLTVTDSEAAFGVTQRFYRLVVSP